jgi:hypothetical protein
MALVLSHRGMNGSIADTPLAAGKQGLSYQINFRMKFNPEFFLYRITNLI